MKKSRTPPFPTHWRSTTAATKSACLSKLQLGLEQLSNNSLAPRNSSASRRLFRHHVYFTKEGVAGVVICLSGRTFKKQIAVLTQAAARVVNAGPILSAAVTTAPAASVDTGNQRPSAAGRIDVALWLSAKLRVGAVAGVERINLRCAISGMPRIRIDLLDFDYAAKVHAETSARRS